MSIASAPPQTSVARRAARRLELSMSSADGFGGGVVSGQLQTAATAEEKPSWFAPKRLLVMLCIINMLNYVDRGVIASNGVNGSRGSCCGGTCSSGSGIQKLEWKTVNFAIAAWLSFSMDLQCFPVLLIMKLSTIFI